MPEPTGAPPARTPSAPDTAAGPGSPSGSAGLPTGSATVEVPVPDPHAPRLFLRRAGVFVCLVGAVFGVHGIALINGFFIDDWHHCLQFGRLSWSWRDLWTGFVFDYTGDILPVWWEQRPAVTIYCRPLTLALHKGLHEVFGLWEPAHHAVNLIFHQAAVFLAYAVARQWFGRRDTALWTALVFAVHPASGLPAQWCAVAAEPMTATWSLASLLAMVHALRRGAAGRPTGWLWAGSYLTVGLAVLSRESAVMLPIALILAGWWGFPLKGSVAAGSGAAPDGTGSGDRPGSPSPATVSPAPVQRPPWWRFAPYFAVSGVYVVTRTLMLGGFPVPPPPYYTPPQSPDFPFQIGCKFLCNLSELALCFPAAPVLSESLLAEHVWIWFLLGGGVAVVGLLLWRALRNVPGAWFWFLWILLFTASTLPMFVSPHYLYLPSLGWGMLVGAAFTRILTVSGSLGRQLAWRALATAIILVYVGYTFVEGLILRAAWTPGQHSLADALDRAGGYPKNAQVWFINLNPLAHQTLQGLRLTQGREDIRGCVLTFSTDLMGPRGETLLTRVGPRSIEVFSPDRWFTGRLGRAVRRIAGRETPFHAGEVIRTGSPLHPVTVTVVEADELGVLRFRFDFDVPLDDPRHVFLLGSEDRFLTPVDVKAMPAGEPTPLPQIIRGGPAAEAVPVAAAEHPGDHPVAPAGGSAR